MRSLGNGHHFPEMSAQKLPKKPLYYYYVVCSVAWLRAVRISRSNKTGREKAAAGLICPATASSIFMQFSRWDSLRVQQIATKTAATALTLAFQSSFTALVRSYDESTCFYCTYGGAGVVP